jgi:hypothetical protein
MQILSHQYDSVTFSAQCRHCCCQVLQLCLLLRQLAFKVLARFLSLLCLKTPARNANCSILLAHLKCDDVGFDANAGLLLRQQAFRILTDLFRLLGLRTPAQTDILRRFKYYRLLIKLAGNENGETNQQHIY